MITKMVKNALFFSAILILLPATAWAQCAYPPGVKGAAMFNETYNVPQYCDGTNWIAMVGGNSSTATPLVVTSGLIGYWPLDGDANDAVGSNNGMLVGNTVYSTGQVNQGITVDGSGDYVNAGSAAILDNLTLLSACTWVNASAGGYGVIMGKTTNGNNGWNLYWAGANGFGLQTPKNAYRERTTGVTRNAWHHLCATWDGTDGVNGVIFYLDGALYTGTGGNDTGADFDDSGFNLQIGGTAGFYFNGRIDDARLYNRVITPTEVTQIYNCGVAGDCGSAITFSTETKIVPTGLIGHWRLDEESGTTAYDSSGSGNDGSYVNGVLPVNNSVIGVIGNSIDFSAGRTSSNNRVTASSIAAYITPQLTFSAWVKPLSFSGHMGLIELTGLGHIRFNWNSNAITFHAQAWSGGDRAWKSAPSGAKINEWVHIAVTYDYSSTANNPIFFVNGAPIDISNTTTPSGIYSAPVAPVVNIGRAVWNGSGANLQGYLDDARIYNRVLSLAEIQEILQARDGIRYNANQRTMEYFDGNQFVSMTPDWGAPTSGLVGHWKLDETTGTTAVDSVNGNNGAMQGSMDAANDSSPGAVGTAVNFDGVDDAIDISSSAVLDNLGPLTVSAWINPLGTAAGTYPIINNDAGTEGDGWIFSIATDGAGNNFISAFIDTTASNPNDYDRLTPYSPALGEWAHVVWTWTGDITDETTSKIYINGAEVGSYIAYNTGVSGTHDSSGSDYRIGAPSFPLGALTEFLGSIDDVRIFNRALSDAEIGQLYVMGTPVGSSTALPQGCPNVGDVCDDGTYYIGNPGPGPVYGTNESFEAFKSYNNGIWGNWTTTGFNSASDGEGNTNGLVITDSETTAGMQPHQAAQYCYDLYAHGDDDWYLPAWNELDLFNNSGSPIAGVMIDGTEYHASNEGSASNNHRQRFDTGAMYGGGKDDVLAVRCVRKGPAPRCANPYGIEGSMVYNTTFDVVQYCDGARWVAIGKAAP